MGGMGSTRWGIKEKREYLDDARSIDINYLNKHHALTTDTDFSLSWGDKEDIVSSMAVRAKDGYLEVLHNQKTDNGYGGPCEVHIGLTHTQCNYGNTRPWFLCPDCDARTAKLYHLESGFICRKCSGLPYQSQSESHFDRSIRKARKIRVKLGVDTNLLVPVLMAPKSMYWKTFDRLHKELERVEKEFFSTLGVKAGTP